MQIENSSNILIEKEMMEKLNIEYVKLLKKDQRRTNIISIFGICSFIFIAIIMFYLICY